MQGSETGFSLGTPGTFYIAMGWRQYANEMGYVTLKWQSKYQENRKKDFYSPWHELGCINQRQKCSSWYWVIHLLEKIILKKSHFFHHFLDFPKFARIWRHFHTFKAENEVKYGGNVCSGVLLTCTRSIRPFLDTSEIGLYLQILKFIP